MRREVGALGAFCLVVRIAGTWVAFRSDDFVPGAQLLQGTENNSLAIDALFFDM